MCGLNLIPILRCWIFDSKKCEIESDDKYNKKDIFIIFEGMIFDKIFRMWVYLLMTSDIILLCDFLKSIRGMKFVMHKV